MYWNSVVSISIYDSYFQKGGQGTGFVIDPNGIIVTNNHVLQPGLTPFVTFPDGTYYWANVLKRDSINDIAILKIKTNNLPIIPLGSSDKVSIGEKIVVIGSPLGLQNTVTEGIISAIRVSEDKKTKILQISAPISPGSSGSPVINISGLCIGIATMFIEKGQSINFAVPIEYVTSLLSATELSGRPIPKLEEVLKDKTPDIVNEAYKKDKDINRTAEEKPQSPPPLSLFTGLVVSQGEQGARVIQIYPGCPSERAGLLVGDLILAINGQKVNTLDEFVKVSEARGRTTEITLFIQRKDIFLEKRLQRE